MRISARSARLFLGPLPHLPAGAAHDWIQPLQAAAADGNGERGPRVADRLATASGRPEFPGKRGLGDDKHTSFGTRADGIRWSETCRDTIVAVSVCSTTADICSPKSGPRLPRGPATGAAPKRLPKQIDSPREALPFHSDCCAQWGRFL